MKTRPSFAGGPTPLALAVAIIASALTSPSLTRVWAQDEDKKEAPAARPIAARLIGHWGLDRDQMLKVMTERAADGAGDQGFDKAARGMLVEAVERMVDRMVLEFKAEGISRVHSPDRHNDASYKFLKSDEKTGEFTLEVVPEGDEAKVDRPEGKIKGDHLSLESDGMELHFRRLGPEEAKTRLAAIRELADKK